MKKFDITSAPLKGRSVIEASAGTGKTYAIAGLFLRLVVEARLKVNQILVVTFTKAATEELRDRIRRRLREAFNALTGNYTGSDPVLLWVVQNYRNDSNASNRLKEALVCFDESAIFTIHGFCQKMLSENAFESGVLFDTELVSDDNDLVVEVCRDYYRKYFFNMEPLLFTNPTVKEIKPEYLLKLIRYLSVDPDFTIIPEMDNIPGSSNEKEKTLASASLIMELAGRLKELQESYLSIQKIWRAEGRKIGEIIINSQGNKAFNGKYIKKTTYTNALSEMDIYVESGNCWNIIKADSAGKAGAEQNIDIPKSASIEKLTDRFMHEKAKDVDKLPVHPLFKNIEEFIDLIDESQKMVNKFCLNLKLNFLKSAGKALKKSKMVRNVRAFDDLLVSMHKAVGNGNTLMGEAVRKRFSAALIDEFQDTDPLQYSIFTNIFQGNNTLLYLIGDPKQAIYGFRGADIYAYLKAKKSVESSYTLGTNWRSDGGLVGAVNSLFDIKGRNPFVIDGIDFIPVSHAPDRAAGSLYIDGKASLPMNIAFIDRSLSKSEKANGFISRGETESFAAKFTAGKISELINMGALGRAVIRDKVKGKNEEGKNEEIEGDSNIISSYTSVNATAKHLGPQDIAVLVRTNRQTFIIQQELGKLGIPGVIYSAGSVYAEEETMEMERVMRAVAEPSNERQLKTALITAFFGFDGSQISKLAVDEKLYDSLQNEFMEYNILWRKSGFISMLRCMMGRRGVKERLLGYTGGERKLTNYLHIAELLHIADMKLRPGIDGLISFLAKRRLSNDDKSGSDEYKLRLETDEKAVKIITVHRSKGLEFPVVFCPYLYHSRDAGKEDILKFHDGAGRQTLDIGSQDFDRNKEAMIKEDFAESVRLAYVALTRAKYACFTIWGRINKSDNSALSWLFHGDKTSIKQLPWEDMKEDVDRIAQNSNNNIGVQTVNVNDIQNSPYSPPKENRTSLSYRNFKKGSGSIPNGWRISSFTSIFSGKESHLPDHDEIDRYPVLPESSESYFPTQYPKSSTQQQEFSYSIPESTDVQGRIEGDFFGFPGGAKSGSCIHEIMENIDFTRPDIKVAKEKLEKFGFKESESTRVKDMLNRLLESDLMFSSKSPLTMDNRSSCSSSIIIKEPDGYSPLYLKQINNEHRINEMEFFLPVNNMNSAAIASIMKRYGSGTTADFASIMKSIGFSQKGGYLKGFIDMVFYHNEKYYLIDWKTNNLGNSFDNYSVPSLTGEMGRSGYVLQYLIYTVALNAYLKSRVIDYSYDDHFGGIFYIFMRGVKPGSDTGIYFDRPDRAFVEQLATAISGER